MRWEGVYGTSDVDSMIEAFNSNILHLLDVHVPLLPTRVSSSLSSCEPWFTQDVRRAILERDLAKILLIVGVKLPRNITTG